MEERLSFPEVIREAEDQKAHVFWRDYGSGLIWWYGLVEDDKTVAAFEGSFYQVLAINSTFIRHKDERRLLPIEAAPPLK